MDTLDINCLVGKDRLDMQYSSSYCLPSDSDYESAEILLPEGIPYSKSGYRPHTKGLKMLWCVP